MRKADPPKQTSAAVACACQPPSLALHGHHQAPPPAVVSVLAQPDSLCGRGEEDQAERGPGSGVQAPHASGSASPELPRPWPTCHVPRLSLQRQGRMWEARDQGCGMQAGRVDGKEGQTSCLAQEPAGVQPIPPPPAQPPLAVHW